MAVAEERPWKRSSIRRTEGNGFCADVDRSASVTVFVPAQLGPLAVTVIVRVAGHTSLARHGSEVTEFVHAVADARRGDVEPLKRQKRAAAALDGSHR